jgi:hypothetical protein
MQDIHQRSPHLHRGRRRPQEYRVLRERAQVPRVERDGGRPLGRRPPQRDLLLEDEGAVVHVQAADIHLAVAVAVGQFDWGVAVAVAHMTTHAALQQTHGTQPRMTHL